jgi:lipopolysaccharide export system protein LptA
VYNVGGGDLYATTDALGAYTITANVGESVTITVVSLTNYTLDAGTPVPVGPFTADTVNIDFEMNRNSFTVTGTVKLKADGSPLAGVTIIYNISGGDLFATTDALGVYTITALVGETVTITDVALTNHTLDIATVLPQGPFTADTVNIDFEMIRDTYTISGTVYLEGTTDPIGGVTIVYNVGLGDLFTNTAADGTYTITVNAGLVVIITEVKKTGYSLIDPLVVLPAGPFIATTTGIDFEMKLDIPVPPPTHYYYITATSDSGSTITPSGQVAVPGGSSQSFFFEAKEDYIILEVIINGSTYLTQAQIDLGYFTFTNVNANHTIEVKSIPKSKVDITLTIYVMSGEGYAEYNLNGAGFVRYTGVVTLPFGSNVVVRAVAADGYKFDRWETPYVRSSSEISFIDIMGPLHLDLYFEEDNGSEFPWWIVAVLVTIVAALFIFFLIWTRPGLFVTVLVEGEAVSGVSVTFRVDNGKKSKSGVKYTNSKGKCWISAKKDSVVTLTNAAKDGSSAINLPAAVAMENRREYFDLLFK